MGGQAHHSPLAGSPVRLPAGPGPVQIVRLGAEGSAAVEVVSENLDAVCEGLARSGADMVSIVGVVGAYRTGKSFLLDLLMRYSRALVAGQRVEEEDEGCYLGGENAHGDGEFGPVKHDKESFIASSASATSVEAPWRLGEQRGAHGPNGAAAPPPLGLPAWVLEGDAARISEGLRDQEGFAWRPGPERCTEGIWMWSTPLVVVRPDGRRVAIVLMDTQGAWDDTLTKHQSATLFGLTALLSSRLIYNVQNNIQEDKLESLDYFMAFAHAACADLPDGVGHFGHLDILVRDWVNYEDGSSTAGCRATMREHLLAHLDAEGVSAEARARAARLRRVFGGVGCFGLVHPGLRATKPGFEGALADVDADFFHLLGEYAAGIFGCSGALSGTSVNSPSRLSGRELRVRHFGDTVRHFATAFRDTEATAVGLRDALVRVELHEVHDELLEIFRGELAHLAPDGTLLDPTVFSRLATAARDTAHRGFSARLRRLHLAKDEENSYSASFGDALNNSLRTREAVNDQAFEIAALKLVATPLFAVAATAGALHPAVLAAAPLAALGGGALSVRRWTRCLGLAPFHPAVLSCALGDAASFAEQRRGDLQAIRVVASHLGPTGCVEMMLSSARQLAGFGEVCSGRRGRSSPGVRRGGSPQAISSLGERRSTRSAFMV